MNGTDDRRTPELPPRVGGPLRRPETWAATPLELEGTVLAGLRSERDGGRAAGTRSNGSGGYSYGGAAAPSAPPAPRTAAPTGHGRPAEDSAHGSRSARPESEEQDADDAGKGHRRGTHGSRAATRTTRPMEQRPRRYNARPARRNSGKVVLLVALVMLAAVVVTVFVLLRGGPATDGIALASTGLAPDAKGTVSVTEKAAGYQVRLSTEGLPAAEVDNYYGVWLRNADGDMVPIGGFHARGNGQDVVLETGVDPKAFSQVSVVRQRVADGWDPSNQVVMTGSFT